MEVNATLKPSAQNRLGFGKGLADLLGLTIYGSRTTEEGRLGINVQGNDEKQQQFLRGLHEDKVSQVNTDLVSETDRENKTYTEEAGFANGLDKVAQAFDEDINLTDHKEDLHRRRNKEVKKRAGLLRSDVRDYSVTDAHH